MFHRFLVSLFGEGYENKPEKYLIRQGRRAGRKIIKDLKPFRKKDSFPESYNPKGVHARFALAFLYFSPYFVDFARIVKAKGKDIRLYSVKDMTQGAFFHYMRENLTRYQCMTIYKTVSFYDEMLPMFYEDHKKAGMGRLVDDKIVLVVDYMNPIEHIKKELEKILAGCHSETDDAFKALAIENGVSEPLPFSPLDYARPLVDSLGKVSRTPETYLPVWYEALMVHRLKRIGHKEKTIIRRVFNRTPKDGNYPSRKTAVYVREKLADRLTHAAFFRLPMTFFHVEEPRP